MSPRNAGKEENWGIAPGGEIIHEVGATKMGDNPKTSVLNQYAKRGMCKNVFVTDAAPFVSNADKNPTLTITALGWRTSEYIVDQVKKFNVKSYKDNISDNLSRRTLFHILGPAPALRHTGSRARRTSASSPRCVAACGAAGPKRHSFQ